MTTKPKPDPKDPYGVLNVVREATEIMEGLQEALLKYFPTVEPDKKGDDDGDDTL